MKVLVFPRGIGNPYQKLLYNELQTQEKVHVEYLEYSLKNLLLLPFILRSKYREGFSIFHLHWPNFYVYKQIRFVKFASFILSSYCVRAIRFSKLKLVWTVHNVLPHKKETTNDLVIAKYIAKHASAKILHSASTIDQMKELGINIKNCHIVPHGNYEGVYQNRLIPEITRETLRIEKDASVVLFFGAIKGYKGINTLLDEFEKLDRKDAYLLIAGKSSDDMLSNKILDTAKRSNRIIFHPGFVVDENVAAYFEVSDIVCLPFKSITTSGSALLALTFQKPLIAPATGSLLDIPKDAGFFYDPSDTQGLKNALALAIDNPSVVKNKAMAAKKYTDSIGWSKIAAQTKKVYDSVSS